MFSNPQLSPGPVAATPQRATITTAIPKKATISGGSPTRHGRNVIRWRTNFTNTIYDVLKARAGWAETKGSDWDFYWVGKDWMNNNYDQHRFHENQKISHFRNDTELTRKDNMARNIKKARRQLEKEGKLEETQKYAIIPPTYILPMDYHMFVEEFKSHPQGTIWIMKPVSGAQGRGIFLFKKLKDIVDWKKGDALKPALFEVESYVVQKYIDSPYLIGGKKFDLRVYVLVTSYSPLKAWLHREGFARFSNTRYSMVSIEDTYVHLTNVAVQKTAPDYDPEKGVKWSLDKLRRFLTATHGEQEVSKLFGLMDEIFICSLLSVQKTVIADRHCFEMYGYDIMIDSNLKPWLIEVNASPSLTASSQEDYELKFRLLNNVLDVADFEKKLNGTEIRVGGFDLFWANNERVLHLQGSKLLAKTFAPRLNTFLGKVVNRHLQLLDILLKTYAYWRSFHDELMQKGSAAFGF